MTAEQTRGTFFPKKEMQMIKQINNNNKSNNNNNKTKSQTNKQKKDYGIWKLK